MTVARRTEGAWSHLAVPRRPGPVRLRFQWIDGVAAPQEALDLLDHGDAAPNLRFRYVYAAP